MNFSLRIQNEVKSLSTWFKAIFAVMIVVYLGFWIFSISLSHIQRAKGAEVLLPSAPKDSHEYLRLSESLMSGQGFAVEGRIETLRLPGYPAFVGIIKSVTGSYFSVTFVQILLALLSVLIVRRIGIYYSSKKVGEIAATLLLINPVVITLSLLILTDILFMFLLVSGFYIAIRITEDRPYRKAVIASLIFVIAIYVRGMGIFVAPIFLAPILAAKVSFKLRVKLMLVMLAILLISTIPWIIRNYKQTGVANFNSFESVGMTFAIPNFLSVVDGTNEAEESVKFKAATGVPDKNWQEYDGRDIRYSKQISAVGEKIIMERPFTYLKYHIVSSIPFLFPSTILFMRDAYDSATGTNRPFKYGSIHALASGDFMAFYEGVKEVWWKFAERLLWLLGLVISVYVLWKERRNLLVWVFVFIPAFLMLISGPTAGPRLSMQAWPFLFMLFAEGGILVVEKIKSLKMIKKIWI